MGGSQQDRAGAKGQPEKKGGGASLGAQGPACSGARRAPGAAGPAHTCPGLHVAWTSGPRPGSARWALSPGTRSLGEAEGTLRRRHVKTEAATGAMRPRAQGAGRPAWPEEEAEGVSVAPLTLDFGLWPPEQRRGGWLCKPLAAALLAAAVGNAAPGLATLFLRTVGVCSQRSGLPVCAAVRPGSPAPPGTDEAVQARAHHSCSRTLASPSLAQASVGSGSRSPPWALSRRPQWSPPGNLILPNKRSLIT